MKKETRGGKRPNAGRPSEKCQTKVKGDQGPPKKPSDLGEWSSRVWDDAVAALPHILRPLDYAILRVACEAFQMAMTDEDPKVRLQAMRAFESHARQIGLTPSSRRIVKPVDEVESHENDPFVEFMRKGGLN